MITSILYFSYNNGNPVGCFRILDLITPEPRIYTTEYVEWFTVQHCEIVDKIDEMWIEFDTEEDAIIFKLRHGV